MVTQPFDRFETVAVHRREAAAGSPCSSPLARFVPKGGLFGYDLIAHVGCETFLRGRKLESVAREFPQIPFSSLYDVQHKFLFHFGQLHRQSARVLGEWFGMMDEAKMNPRRRPQTLVASSLGLLPESDVPILKSQLMVSRSLIASERPR